MKAYLRSARIAPKKANLIAKMVRGMPVQSARLALQRTHKKGARLIETLLQSAVANAQHNDKQDASVLVIKSLVVNQGTAYRRGVPMARGRVRPMSKFLTHISLTLGIADHETAEEKKASAKQKKLAAKRDAAAKEPSQTARNTVKTSSTKTKKEKENPSSDSSASSSSSASS